MNNDNVIKFGQKDTPEEAPEPMFTYQFTDLENKTTDVTGIFTFNPIFYGVTDQDSRLVYMMPADKVKSVYRKEAPGNVQ